MFRINWAVRGVRSALYRVHCPHYNFGVHYTKLTDKVNYLIDRSNFFLPHLFAGPVAENFGENLFYQLLVKNSNLLEFFLSWTALGGLLRIFTDLTLGRVSLIIETRVYYILCHFYIILHSIFLNVFFSDEISYRPILWQLHFGVDHLHSVNGHNIRLFLSHMLKCYISYKNSV